MYFFSIGNFNHKRYLKTIFKLRIKAKVSAKFIYKCTRFVFWFLACTNFAELWKIRYCILQLAYHDFVSCIIHKYVNICSNSWHLQQYNLGCFEPSMGLTPCWKNHASWYCIDSTSLRFNGQVTKSAFLVLYHKIFRIENIINWYIVTFRLSSLSNYKSCFTK